MTSDRHVRSFPFLGGVTVYSLPAEGRGRRTSRMRSGLDHSRTLRLTAPPYLILKWRFWEVKVLETGTGGVA